MTENELGLFSPSSITWRIHSDPAMLIGGIRAPAWATIAALAGSALPNWARSLYGWPTLPGQKIATDIAMIALRKSLLAIPFDGLLPPTLVEARIRWGAPVA